MTFTGELGVELEIRNRRTLSGMDRSITVTNPEQTMVINICPKLETELRVFSWLALFGGVGLDFVVGNFPYSVLEQETEEKSVILEPYLIRLSVHVGLAFMN